MTVWRQPETPFKCIRPILLRCALRNSAFALRVRTKSGLRGGIKESFAPILLSAFLATVLFWLGSPSWMNIFGRLHRQKMTFITKGNKLFYAACAAFLVSRICTSGTYNSRYLDIRTCDFRPHSVQLWCRANIFDLINHIPED